VALSVAILAWFALRVDYDALGALVRHVRLPVLAALAALSLFRMWISAVRFRVLSTLVVDIPFWTLVRQYFVALPRPFDARGRHPVLDTGSAVLRRRLLQQHPSDHARR
jgi:hypothetical protein